MSVLIIETTFTLLTAKTTESRSFLEGEFLAFVGTEARDGESEF